MNIVLYDGSYPGLLSAIFEVYEYKLADPQISVNAADGSLFSIPHIVHTDEQKARRVLNKLKEKLSRNALKQLYKCHLSEEKDIANTLLGYVQRTLKNKKSVENDFTDAVILKVQQLSRKVDREKHRMEAFVRFQCTKDELYYAFIQPDYNVLPLISAHFEKRYADQRWLIYDTLRKKGIYYDLVTVQEITMLFKSDLTNAEVLKTINDDTEELYQVLWKQYFQSVNIKARKNTKLHIQHMPKRYWKNLIEKQGCDF